MIDIEKLKLRVAAFKPGFTVLTHDLVKGARADAPYIPLVWSNELRRGDCTIRSGAELRVFKTGATHWECDISSTDSGDESMAQILCGSAGFDGNDPNTYDRLLFVLDGLHIDIHDENAIKRWVEDHESSHNEYQPGIGPLEVWEQLAAATLFWKC